MLCFKEAITVSLTFSIFRFGKFTFGDHSHLYVNYHMVNIFPSYHPENASLYLSTTFPQGKVSVSPQVVCHRVDVTPTDVTGSYHSYFY